jgi:hypothetical protein
MSDAAMFSDSEIAGLIGRGFTVANSKKMAEITSGEITVAVVGRRNDGLFQLIIKVPNGMEIFGYVSPNEIMGDWSPPGARQ